MAADGENEEEGDLFDSDRVLSANGRDWQDFEGIMAVIDARLWREGVWTGRWRRRSLSVGRDDDDTETMTGAFCSLTPLA